MLKKKLSPSPIVPGLNDRKVAAHSKNWEGLIL
jgi:hypothetical protein